LVSHPIVTSGLRDRKKAKLRETILETALRLFAADGYEATTLERICEEAETSLRTLLRYFPTKEALALGRESGVMEQFGEELARLDPGTPVIAFWRERVRDRSRDVDPKTFLAQLKLMDAVPAVTAKMLTLQVGYENMLAAAFAREAGLTPGEDLYGRLLAGMLIAGNRAASRKWHASGGQLSLSKLRTDVVDWTLENFPSRGAVVGTAPPTGTAGPT
jgi:AcrR family transcriptional regulator